MVGYSSDIHKYAHLWSKYRPAILKLMLDSANEPQEYRFSKHEFYNVNPKEKGGHAFTLNAFQSRAINDIKTSVLAKDLLMILKSSKKATELMENSTYEISMDKQFILHIKKESALNTETNEDF